MTFLIYRNLLLAKLLCFLTMLTACSSVEHKQQNHTPKLDPEQQLMIAFDSYAGTPYRYGGTDKQGMDCSGFIQVIYREVFGQPMPRTTADLARSGASVSKSQLQAGDIVMFKTGRKVRHAGIYVGDKQFIHASTSKGVIQSSLDNRYWKSRYWQARRYL